jgi:hypothetical protein
MCSGRHSGRRGIAPVERKRVTVAVGVVGWERGMVTIGVLHQRDAKRAA